MKIDISRQNLFLILMLTFLLGIVVVFSLYVLIPEGKEYRERKMELTKEYLELRRYQDFYDETFTILKELQSKNKNIIEAFDNRFDSERFHKLHIGHFNSLSISEVQKVSQEEEFGVYEVNTTSHINSPTNFYDFLDSINKSNWIIGINFPIHFQREGEMIRSSFTMRVYTITKDANLTK
ncbi:MAG: hypothetical protein RBR59_01000 [Sulfurimonadaceae bacterium]|nr:hypothetical protein [Sulfurimonadaceae bacterium]